MHKCLILGLVLLASCENTGKVNQFCENALQFASIQLENSITAINDSTKFPRTTDENNNWITKQSNDWTAGFFPGCLWYMYEFQGENKWKDWAQKWTAGMFNEQFNTGTHDTGFMMYCSYGNGHRLTEDPEYKKVLLQTAESLSSRFNDNVKCIKSWDWMKPVEEYPFPVIIDNMMNLELLFWASKVSGETKYKDMAIAHATTTQKNHIREDGSTWHVLQYDPITGDVVKKHTWQGYSDESCWARGQAWGIYGFTVAYRETKNDQFLNTAQQLSDYFIDHLPQDAVPFWDFNAPNIPDEERDSSAGAIAASGMIELSRLCPVASQKEKYWKTATRILKSLAGPNYLAKNSNNPAILLHAVGAKPREGEIDVPLIYGDYYFIEGLLRYRTQKEEN